MARPRNRIRELRMALGLSAEELGALVGKPQSAISRLELGQQALTLDLMHPLADALRVRAADLIADDRQVPWGVVSGTLEHGGRFYGIEECYPLTIPFTWLQGELHSLFRKEHGLIVAAPRFPTPEHRGRRFVISYDFGDGQPRPALRTYEVSGSQGGFSAEGGDPALRWIRASESRISKTWGVLAEFRWFEPPVEFAAPLTSMR